MTSRLMTGTLPNPPLVHESFRVPLIILSPTRLQSCGTKVLAQWRLKRLMEHYFLHQH